jgi:hypothetical protein
VLRRGVQHVRVDRREDDGIRPLPPLLHRARRLTLEHARVWVHFAQLSRAPVESGEEAAVVRATEEDIDVLRVGGDVPGLAAADNVERVASTAAATTTEPELLGARDARRAVVLLRATDVEGHVLRRHRVVELCGRKVLRAPPAPARGRDGAAAVVPIHEVLRVVRVDPQVVMVAVRPLANVRQGLAAIRRPEE